MWEINAKINSDWKDQRDVLYILDREYQPLRLSQSHKGSKTTYAFMLKQMIPFLKLDMISLKIFFILRTLSQRSDQIVRSNQQLVGDTKAVLTLHCVHKLFF